ncbi:MULTISPECIES: rhomboid family intramembrane serine protease [Paracoccus]|uniref:rhomboid family intramembrane serine protease n=1 Tax=Paracoccus TaxID=265 RepID=UPI00086C9309|nr:MULTISPECIES: rhomboid family intramembrane serine protease [Paracoccus]ODT58784.1 MAG: hypothetical protein ABS73_11990 [Paracoccus sp. SCN 68-21]
MTDPGRPVAFPQVARADRGPAPLPLWLRGMVVACCLIEALTWAGPMLGLGSARVAGVMLGGFWPPLMTGAAGLYPGQGVAMFLTYGLLHGGVLHLAMNMISLAAVGRELVRMIGSGRMALTYLVSQIVAGAVFAWMEPTAGPMVGASGAVFGLAGALVGHAAINLHRRHRSMAPLIRATALILGLNIVLTLLMPAIAWQAHLGGGLAGLVLGIAFALSGPPRR